MDEKKTLRDEFAMAVVGHYMHLCHDSILNDAESEIPTLSEYAVTAYRVADAMLAARKTVKGAGDGKV